jgi:hypothetical protein
MATIAIAKTLREKYELLSPAMTERMRRHWASAEAVALGRGGVTLLAGVTGLSRTTITAGIRELRDRASGADRPLDPSRCRRPGAGRPFLETDDATLLSDLEELVDPATRGDPMSPLLWTSKSTRQLAEALETKGHTVSHSTVGKLLHCLGYSMQSNRKTRDGSSHPDRNAQFEYINRQVLAFQKAGQPVVSVDAKKKENLGDFKNGGAEWQPEGEPEEVRTKDFPDKKLGKAIPYGVYDLTCEKGWVSVGIDHDTARFAVETVRRWWAQMVVIGAQNGPTSARKTYPPGFNRTLREASPLATAALLCSCSCRNVLLRFARQVKRSRALRGRNPTRDSLTDGVPMVHLYGPRPPAWSGACFPPPLDTRVHASENPGGLGAEPPGLRP